MITRIRHAISACSQIPISGVNIIIKLIICLSTIIAPYAAYRVLSCDSGWFQYAESCYYHEKERLNFTEAEKKCDEKGGTLFVANSKDEWDLVHEEVTERYYSHFSWIGLVGPAEYERIEDLPHWKTEGGLNSSKINWLSNPYKPVPNGWTSMTNCVAYYERIFSFGAPPYAFYYPCTSKFHSICERNATLIKLSGSSSDNVPYFEEDKLKDELAPTKMSCSEFKELGGNVMTPAAVGHIAPYLVTKGVWVIARQELRVALNFGPVPPIADYNETKPSKEELAAAPTLEAYYNLKESRHDSSHNNYVLDSNLPPALAFLDKKYPSIRALFKHKIQEILQTEGGMTRESIDRWISELRQFDVEKEIIGGGWYNCGVC